MATNYAHQRLDSTYSQLGEGHNGSMEFQTPPEPSILTGNKRELRWAVGSANGPRSSIWKVKAVVPPKSWRVSYAASGLVLDSLIS